MKKYKLRILIYLLVLCGELGLLVFSCYNYWDMSIKTGRESKKLEEQLNKLKDEELDLENKRVKLQDKEYLIQYANEQFLYSKDGVTIINFKDLEKEKEEE